MAALSSIDGYAALFHDGSPNSQGEANSALNRLATCIVDGDFEPFLNRLLDPSSHTTPSPLALELILSCKHYQCGLVSQTLISLLATECGQLFANWLLSCFPLHPEDLDFYWSSSAFRILTKRLSPYLLLECALDRDLVGKLRICHSRVLNAPLALKALSKAIFPNLSEMHTAKDEIDLELEYPIFRKSQRQRKALKGSVNFFNPQTEKALAVFNLSVPSNAHEAEGQITAILKDQQDVLKVFNLFMDHIGP